MLDHMTKRKPQNDADVRTQIEALAEMASQGDKKALCGLIEKISKSVLFQLTYLLNDKSSVEDVSQNVLLRVCENICGLRKPKAFKGWLARIIINENNRYLAKNLRLGGSLNIDDYTDSMEDGRSLPHERVENNELHKTVIEIISGLPERQREAVILHYYNDLSVTEVAKLMNITPQTVSKNLSIAREKLYSIIIRI
ncbi:MAG: sigma-70 family RNA polymerase sigma factor [Defluviitaleaceae bacterium]|nr:sigma-70 family RNA polymerase sigma factor [Defluviitaleaceae bacterium]